MRLSFQWTLAKFTGERFRSLDRPVPCSVTRAPELPHAGDNQTETRALQEGALAQGKFF